MTRFYGGGEGKSNDSCERIDTLRDHRHADRNESILDLSDHARCLACVAKVLVIVTNSINTLTHFSTNSTHNTFSSWYHIASRTCSGEASILETGRTCVGLYLTRYQNGYRIKMDTDLYPFFSLEVCSLNTTSIFRIGKTPWLAAYLVTERKRQGSSEGTIHAMCCK